ncbi:MULTISPECIES: DUF6151 family protein [Phaeobacter]|nr:MULTISPECIES: DUF6151 family protein [Phaeobacter]MDE4061289.1 DUF6151 family protein [Phaeobacter gallaeciensis]MDE4124308.1 DUF6151 family protein [Phaeobacter gallaeciensis]MDE4128836.1 DUF6151 family protein [Phaeobacter gallaeciensis]PVZ44997.1 hypothetical protein DD556_18855 [Phaeobacter sp. JL2872]
MASEQDHSGRAFSCSCGTMQGYITPEALKSGTHIACFCADCRANELYHHRPDPAPGPVALFQMSPDGIHITQGAEELRLMRLSPKGLFRWYAGCCGMPFANTLAKPGLPFAGMRTNLFDQPEIFGKIRTRAFEPQPGRPPRTKGAGTMVYALFRRMITARLSGKWKETPFFEIETGRPVSEPIVLSKADRDALTQG